LALPWRSGLAGLGLILALHSGSPDRALAIDCGEVVTSTLSSPGESDDHAFDGSAGQRVAFFVASDFDASVELLGPGGAPVAVTAQPGFAGAFGSEPFGASGSYTLRVSAVDTEATGTYQLALLGPGCEAGAPLRCGETVPATVASGGLGLHFFRADAGDRVRVNLGRVPGTLASSSALVAPDGSFLLSTNEALAQGGLYRVVATAVVSETPGAAPPEPEPAPLRERFLSPGGSDANDGLSAASPWRSFAWAIPRLASGDQLTLLDGTYDVASTGLLHADCGADAPDGALGAPITVRAANERRALLVSDGSTAPVNIEHCSHWSLIGLAARNADLPTLEPGDVFRVRYSDHIVLRRLLAAWPNRYRNAHAYAVGESRDVLVEECEAYGFHRHGVSAYQSENVTIRRSYVNSRGQLDLPDGYVSDRPGGDESFVLYASSNSVIENSVAEFETRGFEIHGGQTHFGTPGGYHNQVLGSIHYSGHSADHFGAGVDTRMGEGTGFVVRPAYDNLFKDFVVLEPGDEAFVLRSPVKAALENVTLVSAIGDAIDFKERASVAGNGSQPICGVPLNDPFFAGMDRTIFPGSTFECSMTLVNGLILNSTQSGLSVTVPSGQWRVEHTNSVGNAADQFEDDDEDPADALGNVRFSGSVPVTGMGPGGSGTWVFVPPDSNLSRAGRGGGDVGANVLLRYQDRLRTNLPLWDPASGAFPCGATVAGVNDAAAGPSCATLHARLGVTHAALAPALAAVDPVYTLTLEPVSAGIAGGANGPPDPVCGTVPDGTQAIACGETRVGRIDVPGDTDTFSLLAQAGEQVSVAIDDGSSLFAPAVRLFDPAGVRVDFAGGAVWCGPSASCLSLPLAATGTYTVRVTTLPASTLATGEYTLGASRSPSCVTACSNGLDDDGDGRIDHPGDAGCSHAGDLSEAPECDDGIDNDGDGETDYAGGDAGCFVASSSREDPACDNGVDDDGDGLIDADGAGGAADPGCSGLASRSSEKQSAGSSFSCGLGAELVLLLPVLAALRRRRARR
jgi:hypothetical protein